MSELDFIKKKNKWLGKIAEWIKAHGGDQIIPFSVAFEGKLLDMSEEARAAYCAEVGAVSQLPKIIKAGFNALQLQYFFTAGEDEVRAWTVKKGSKVAFLHVFYNRLSVIIIPGTRGRGSHSRRHGARLYHGGDNEV